jgi:hypothetical protein
MKNKIQKQKSIELIVNGLVGVYKDSINVVQRQFQAYAKSRIRKGIRHGNHKYNGFFDSLAGSLSMEYGLHEILMGKTRRPIYVQGHQIGTEEVEVVRPNSPYKIGRYMALADRLLDSGLGGDVDAALTAIRVYQWLGQGNRQSVRNKMKKVYDNAVNLSKVHNVPLAVYGNRQNAIMPYEYFSALQSYARK